MRITAAYLTALGSDAFSDGLIDAWSAEGLDTSFVLIDPERQPVLYAIRTDAGGNEASFIGESNRQRGGCLSCRSQSSFWHKPRMPIC